MENTRLKSARGVATLLGVKGLGPATALKLAAGFETLGDVCSRNPDDLKGFANEPIRRLLCSDGPEVRQAAARADEEMSRAEDLGAAVLTPWDAAYPARLSGIPDRPLILYTSGDLGQLDRSVACVGSREPTRFGATVSERLSSMLAEAGFTIVSGLARGVDAICHETALKAGTPTAAVLGSGIDTYSSDAAFAMASRIVEAGGVIMTEQPLGREADPSSLIRRNRIVTGSSAATFFMQAAMESGTMHSVRYAILQGRPVYAPGVPAAFAEEDLNQAAMLMTRMEAVHFGQAIEAKESVLEALAALGRPHVAREISGRDSYPSVIAELEDTVSADFAAAPSPAP